MTFLRTITNSTPYSYLYLCVHWVDQTTFFVVLPLRILLCGAIFIGNLYALRCFLKIRSQDQTDMMKMLMRQATSDMMVGPMIGLIWPINVSLHLTCDSLMTKDFLTLLEEIPLFFSCFNMTLIIIERVLYTKYSPSRYQEIIGSKMMRTLRVVFWAMPFLLAVFTGLWYISWSPVHCRSAIPPSFAYISILTGTGVFGVAVGMLLRELVKKRKVHICVQAEPTNQSSPVPIHSPGLLSSAHPDTQMTLLMACCYSVLWTPTFIAHSMIFFGARNGSFQSYLQICLLFGIGNSAAGPILYALFQKLRLE